MLSESLSRIAVPGAVFRKIVDAKRIANHTVVYRKNEGAPVVTRFIDYVRAQTNQY